MYDLDHQNCSGEYDLDNINYSGEFVCALVTFICNYSYIGLMGTAPQTFLKMAISRLFFVQVLGRRAP